MTATVKGWGPVTGVLLSGLWLCYIMATLPPISKFSPAAYVRREAYGARAPAGQSSDMLELLGRPFFASEAEAHERASDHSTAPQTRTPDPTDGVGVGASSLGRIAAALTEDSGAEETWMTALELERKSFAVTQPQPRDRGKDAASGVPPEPDTNQLPARPAADPVAKSESPGSNNGPDALPAAGHNFNVAAAAPAPALAPAPPSPAGSVLAKFTERTFDPAHHRGSVPVAVTLESLSE